MATRSSGESIRPSVLDRLLGEAGAASGGMRPYGTVAMMQAAVLRDVEWLLNTRRIHVQVGDERPELQKSVFRYGLADVTSMARGSAVTAAMLARDIHESISLFEPRLAQVRVTPQAEDDPKSRALRFLIEAVLNVDPEPIPIAFDTRLEVGRGQFRVEADGE